MKILGHISLGALLGALGIKLIVVEDPEQLERVQARLTPRKYRLARPRAQNAGPVAAA
jgi:hypothetical protein